MKCHECRETILDTARGVPAADAEEQAREHVQVCVRCRRYLDQQQELTAGLRALASADAVPSEALEARLLKAVEAAAAVVGGADEGAALPQAAFPPGRSSSDGATSRESALNGRRFVYRALPVAAALLLAACVAAWWQMAGGAKPDVPAPRASSTATSTGGSTPEGSNAPARTAPPHTSARVDAERGDPTAAAGRTSTRTQRPRRPRATRIVRASGFVGLPGADMLPAFERGEIVRVRIRLGSLVSLGFSVQPDVDDGTPVNADLLVGQDGQPRAIRLITTDNQDSRSRR